MSGVAQQCRAWLKDRHPEYFTCPQVAEGIGHDDSRVIGHVVFQLFRGGFLERTGECRHYRYRWLRDPTRRTQQSKEARRLRQRAYDAAARRASGVPTREEWLQERRDRAAVRRALLAAEKEQGRIQREAEREERRAQREREKAAAKRHAKQRRKLFGQAGGRLKTDALPARGIAISIPPRKTKMHEAPRPKGQPETVEEWMQRTGQAPEVLPTTWGSD